MRIAVTGTHSTGKTTLVRELSKLLGLPMIEEVARGIIRSYGFQTTQEYIDRGTPEQKKRIQSDILAAQMLAEDKLDCFVSYRTVFDPVAYAKIYGVPDITVNIWIGKAVEHALNTYDLIVYLPPVIKTVDDGFRSTDEHLRLRYDALLSKYIHAFCLFGGRRITLLQSDLEQRINVVMEYAKAFMDANTEAKAWNGV